MRELKKGLLLGLIALVAVLTTATVGAMLNVQVSNVGSVVGQTKELTISAQGAVQVLGSTLILPTCLGAAASSFADVATTTLNWGVNLQSNTDLETFFCLGNIGANAGTVHVITTGQASGETEVFEQAHGGLLGGVSFSPCDGAVIQRNGVIAVRGHLHTPAVGLNGQVALTGKTVFTFS